MSTVKKINIIFSKISDRPFVHNDILILKNHFNVKTIDFFIDKKDPYHTAKFLIRLFWHILRSDVSYVWFANYNAYLAVKFSKMMHKKSIVVIGGHEVVALPEIGYGGMCDPRGASVIKYVINNASKILAVSNFSKGEILPYAGDKTKISLVYNGVDPEKFTPGGNKENLVITVGYITKTTVKIKGFETFLEASRLLPDIKFAIIGECSDGSREYLRSMAPENVDFISNVSTADIIGYYQKAKVYCQLSLRESFGVSLAEAMLCECVPVVTRGSSLSEVAGDAGFYVDYGNADMVAEMISRAMQSDKGAYARDRAKTMFSLEKREIELTRTIHDLMECA